MRDTSIPSFLIPQDSVSINITISGTDAVVEDQGITYNQAGMTYNQAGIMYGGVYNVNEDIYPFFSLFANDYPLHLNITGTDAGLEDQGYTYNQVALTYNQLGVMYAGIYNSNEDIVPLLVQAKETIPSVSGFIDIYTPFIPPPSGNNISLAPGFFMYITH